VARMGAELDLDMVVVAGADVEPAADDLALVVAAHGRDELSALGRGLEAGLPYVGLVASRVRGSAVVAELHAEGLAEERLADLETPAGLDIGARTPEEIALSILARIVAVRRGEQTLSVRVVAPAPAAAHEPATAIDPVCGMAVAAVAQTPHVDHEGRRVYFCCDGCRSTWTRSHVPQ
jgi:xanthine dehydrogenase accessory factor